MNRKTSETNDSGTAPVLRTHNLALHFDEGRTKALDGVDIEIFEGEFVAITGPSGCGKSSLLNLIGTLDNPTKGELFFCNQLNYTHQINYPKHGDFIIDNKYTFEVGGKNKNTKQIYSVENSFLALDEIESGFNNKIPLWLFGFLY